MSNISKSKKGKYNFEKEERFCECKCGDSFECKVTSKRRFIQGHNTRIPIEVRYCQCGCNESFKCKITSKQRFIHGHHRRIPRETRTCSCGKTFECKITSKKRYCTPGCWKVGKTKETHEGLRKIADKLTGRTKETHEGVKRQADKLRGRTKETHEGLRRMADKIRGRTKETHEGVKRQAEKITGKNHPMYGKKRKHPPGCTCCTCEAKRGNNKGKNHPCYGKPCPAGKRFWFEVPGQGKVWLRSSWELIYAKYLVAKRTRFKYECKRFYLDAKTYLPDFYLVDEDKFKEVKGWMRDSDLQKLKEMKRFYPNVVVELVGKDEIKKLEKELAYE